jgi:hypothetical protein
MSNEFTIGPGENQAQAKFHKAKVKGPLEGLFYYYCLFILILGQEEVLTT